MQYPSLLPHLCLLFYALAPIRSIITPTTQNISNNLGRTISVTSGASHLTIAFSYDFTATVKQIDMYHPENGTRVTLWGPNSSSVSGIREPRNYNSIDENIYIFESPNGYVSTENFTNNRCDWQNFYNNTSTVNTTFGSQSTTVYVLFQSVLNCQITMLDANSCTFVPIATKINYQCKQISYESGKIYVLIKQLSTRITFLQVYDITSLNVTENIQIRRQNSQSTSSIPYDYRIHTLDRYLCLFYFTTVQIFDTSNLNSNICKITIAQYISDAKIVDKWLIISHAFNVSQYHLPTCTFFGSSPLQKSSLLEALATDPVRIYAWDSYSYAVTGYMLEDKYSCIGCSACIEGYDLINAQCIFRIGAKEPNSCFQLGQYACQSFCNFKCQTCSHSPDQCDECSLNRIKTSSGTCDLPVQAGLAVGVTNIFSIMRISQIQTAFILVDSFEKYQYHRTGYTGIVKTIIDNFNMIENLKWSILPIDAAVDWLDVNIKMYSPYNSHTNYKFLEVQRQNAFFIQTTKQFFIFYLPVTFMVFALLNRFNKSIKCYKINQIFKSYSKWYYFIFITITSNSSKLSFLAFQYFQILYSFSIQTKLSQAISLLLCGFLIIAIVSIFYFGLYFCRGSTKYFFPNIKQKRSVYSLVAFRLSLFPLLETALHIFLFNNPSLQLFLLSVLMLVFVILGMIFQLKSKIFKSKTVYLIESIMYFSFFLVNLQLALQIYINNEESDIQQLSQIINKSIYCSCFVMMISSIFLVAQTVISFVVKLVCCWGVSIDKKTRNGNSENMDSNEQAQMDRRQDEVRKSQRKQILKKIKVSQIIQISQILSKKMEMTSMQNKFKQPETGKRKIKQNRIVVFQD